jgi:hypothetical protein
MPDIVTRAAAKERGLKRFYTGVPCPHGHVAERYTSTSTCVECNTARRVAWRAVNRDKEREAYNAKRMANRVNYNARCRELYRRDPERALSRVRKHIAKDPDAYKAKFRAWLKRTEAKRLSQISEWRAAHPEKVRGIKRAWKARNKDWVAESAAHRRALQIKATPAWASRKAIRAFYREAQRISRETGLEHHVDHIVPLRGRNVCGLHVEHNLQILPGPENVRKGNRI